MRFSLIAFAPCVGASGLLSSDWEIANGAILKGKEFKDSSISRLASKKVASYNDCLDACAKDSTCKSFDFVGDATLNDDLLGVSTGDCWFRLDDEWEVSASRNYNHTSGRRTVAPTPVPPALKKAKNVLFVLFDDLRAMHKAYGWTQPSLPNADRMAAESLVLDRAYVQQAVCGPSRASILSGRRPDRTQMWNFQSFKGAGGFRVAPGASEWRTWPQYFASKGYYTAGVGKTYHHGDPANQDPPSWTEPECNSPGKIDFPFWGQGQCPIPKLPHGQHGCAVDTDVYTNCSDGTVECFPDFKTLAKAKEFLGKAADQRKSTGQPFWMMVGFVRPHVPHVFPKKYFDQVPARDDIDLAPNSNFTEGGLPISWLKEGPAKGIDIPTDPTSARSFKRGYYAAAAFSDDLLGQLLDEVDKLGLKDDTAVILSSDHGWGLGEHNHWLKYTNFETDAMVPVFIRAPWKTSSQGKRSAALVETIDFYPTLVELAGIPLDKNESVDGTSFAHLLDNPDAEHKDAAFSQYPRCWDESVGHTYDKPMARCAGVDRTKFALMGYSMRTDGWRYTEWVEWDGSKLQANWNKLAGVELYDHSKIATNNTKERFEQTENSNLAASADKATLQRLSKQLRDFFSADGPATEFVSFTV